MASQLLVNVLSVTVPAGATNYAADHGLRSNDQAVAPTLILPSAQSAVSVAFADDTNVYLANPSDSPVTVTLRCERGLSNEVDAETLTPFFQSVGSGVGVVSVSATSPLFVQGSPVNPIISVPVGSGAGSVCAGNDTRLNYTKQLGNTITPISGTFSPNLAEVQPLSFGSGTYTRVAGKMGFGLVSLSGSVTNTAIRPVTLSMSLGEGPIGGPVFSVYGRWSVPIPPDGNYSLGDFSVPFLNVLNTAQTVTSLRFRMTLGVSSPGDAALVSYSVSSGTIWLV